MLIGVPAESFAGETRVAVTPETAKKLKAQGHTLRIQSGAGVRASVTDAAERVKQAWAAFAADARRLHAAERSSRVRHQAAIQTDHARLERFSELEPATDVAACETELEAALAGASGEVL